MKKLLRFTTSALLVVLFGSAAMAANPKKYITSNITVNTTWDRDTTYVLGGFVYVTSNAVLTIESGTVIYGYDGTLFSKGALIITKGAQINAIGCETSPIVFTSGLRVKTRGDWGGLILLGKASINQPGGVANIEGITPSSLTEYGGGLTPDDNDNSGTLQYVRVEYAGVALSPNNEINGLTMGGVGNGTTIDHIMVSYSNDDSYEWFGGTVNGKYLIAFRGIDDDFDTDNGFRGKLQFGIGLRDKGVADVSGSKAFESDNDASASNNTPQTAPTFCNFTCTAGGDTTTNALYTAGAHIRRWSHMNLYNSIIMGYPKGLLIDANSKVAPNTFTNVANDTLVGDNIIAVYTLGNNRVVTAGPAGDSATIQRLRDNAGNTFFKNNSQGVKLTAPWTVSNTVSPDFRPKRDAVKPGKSSPALKNANFNHSVLNDAFFTVVNFRGAMDDTASHDWTKFGTWVNWRPDTVGKVGPGYTVSQGGACSPAPFTSKKQIATAAIVKVSPNPTNGSFIVDVKGFSTAQVMLNIADLNNGHVFYTTRVNNNSINRISVNIPNGYYSVSITDGKSVVSTKVNILH